MNIRKIFSSLPVFLTAFIVISMAADISFLERKTTSYRGEAGWDGMPDFKVFWLAGNFMAEKILGQDLDPVGSRPLYDKEESFYHFRYSPISAIIMSPFGVIPFPRVAMMLWLILGNAVFLAALLILSDHMKKRALLRDTPRVFMLWIMFLGTLRYYFVVICQGQTDGIVTLLLVLLLISYIGRKDIISGILFAAILQIKPFFFILGIFFLIDRRFRVLLWALISICFFTFLPAVFVGFKETFRLTKDWLCMVRISVPSQVLNYKNQSLSYGAALAVFKFVGINKFASPQALVVFFSGFFSAVSLGAFLLFEKYLKTGSRLFYEHFAISFILAVTVVFSPISWEAYYMFLIIPLALVFTMAVAEGREKRMIYYLAGYFILTLSTGTDITKLIPVMDKFRFVNISVGTILLIFGIIDLYLWKEGSSVKCQEKR